MKLQPHKESLHVVLMATEATTVLARLNVYVYIIGTGILSCFTGSAFLPPAFHSLALQNELVTVFMAQFF